MRKAIVAALVALAFGLGAPALADPPNGDPTCETPQQSGPACAGDNGGRGCQGVNRAPDNPGTDLVSDILEPGIGDDNQECEAP